jgi:hypothetical protein
LVDSFWAVVLRRGSQARRAPVRDPDYQALTLPVACQALIALGDLRTVHQYCDDLDDLDAHYLRSTADLATGTVTAQAVRIRRRFFEVSSVGGAGAAEAFRRCRLAGEARPAGTTAATL